MLSSVGIVGLVETAGIVNPLLGEIHRRDQFGGCLPQIAEDAWQALHAFREMVFVGLRRNQGRELFDGELVLTSSFSSSSLVTIVLRTVVRGMVSSVGEHRRLEQAKLFGAVRS